MKLRLLKDLRVDGIGFKHTFTGNSFIVEHNAITVRRGYTWDGLSFVPDGEKDANGRPYSWKAGCVHDVLYQETNPLTRKMADKLFYNELKKIDFKNAWLYYAGVRVLGLFFYRGGKDGK